MSPKAAARKARRGLWADAHPIAPWEYRRAQQDRDYFDTAGDALMDERHLTLAELEAGLGEIEQAPKDEGLVQLIVRRPQTGERDILQEGELDLVEGLVGDNWRARGSSGTADGSPHPDMQLTIMNARAAALVAQHRERWQLAGDQLFIDLDISEANLPAGTRLALGSAIVEVTAQPHTGCKKFVARFGLDAMNFVNSPMGRQLRLRGLNARVIQPGVVHVGDVIKKIQDCD